MATSYFTMLSSRFDRSRPIKVALIRIDNNNNNIVNTVFSKRFRVVFRDSVQRDIQRFNIVPSVATRYRTVINCARIKISYDVINFIVTGPMILAASRAALALCTRLPEDNGRRLLLYYDKYVYLQPLSPVTL